MAKKKPEIDPKIVEAIWAAGFISSSGSLTLVKSGHSRVVRLVVTTSLLPESIERLAAITGTGVYTLPPASKKSQEGKRISIQGASLHAFMTKVWDYLTTERKLQYAHMRKQITSTLEGPNPYRDNTTGHEGGSEIE